MIAGYTESEGQGGKDGFIAKLDASGRRMWMKVVGGTNTDNLLKMVKLETGGYIACGDTESGAVGGVKIILVRFTEMGNIEWVR